MTVMEVWGDLFILYFCTSKVLCSDCVQSSSSSSIRLLVLAVSWKQLKEKKNFGRVQQGERPILVTLGFFRWTLAKTKRVFRGTSSRRRRRRRRITQMSCHGRAFFYSPLFVEERATNLNNLSSPPEIFEASFRPSSPLYSTVIHRPI